MQWHIGCSGFSYREWKEKFYPQKLPQRRWFEYYAEKYNTLELNTTFYRFPRVKTLQNWYTQSPQKFLFSVKAPRLITHYKKFNDCEKYLSDFYSTIREGLQEKLGPVLFQLPKQLVYDKILLSKLHSSLDPSFQNVIEFRHESWWKKSVYTALAKHNISFCGINHPHLPTDVVVNTPFVYYRFHGAPKLYYSEYNDAVIKSFAEDVMKSRKAKNVFVYFNNTATLAAINNANQLKQYTAE